MQDVEILFIIFFVDRIEQPSERLTGLCLMKCSSKMLQNLFGIWKYKVDFSINIFFGNFMNSLSSNINLSFLKSERALLCR